MGLITWSVHGRLDDGVLSELQASVSPTERPGYAQLVRLDLPDASPWPAPATRGELTWHHYGRLDHPPGPPPGIRVVGPGQSRDRSTTQQS